MCQFFCFTINTTNICYAKWLWELWTSFLNGPNFDFICWLVKGLGGPVIQLSHHKISTDTFFSSTGTNNLFLNGVNIPTHCFLLFDVVSNEMLKESEEVVVRAVFLSFFCT